MYDFKTVVNRRQQGSAKWFFMDQKAPNLAADIIPMSVADTDFVLMPELVKGLQEYLETMVLGYTLPTQSYYEAVIHWFKRRHHWEVKQEWIIPSPGVITALYNAVSAFTAEGDGVIIMSPVYYPFRKSIESQNRVVVENFLIKAENTYLIDFDDLEVQAQDAKNKLLILCSPHNPVGRVWKREELERVHEICLKHQVLVLSDEVHFDLIMPGYEHTIFATLNEAAANNSIIATAPSKTFNLAGLQTSNIIIPNEKIREVYSDTMMKRGTSALNAIGPKACELAYNEGEAWLNEFIALIDSNRQLFASYIEKNIPEIQAFPLEGTFLQWFDCSGLNMSDEELNEFMIMECKLFLDAGNTFGSKGEQFQRINLACPTAKLEEALERLHQAVQKRR